MELDRLKLAEMKRAEVIPNATGLYVLFEPLRDVPGQGRIIGREGDFLLVQRFCVVTGEHDPGIRLMRAEELRGCLLYRTAEQVETKWHELVADNRRREENLGRPAAAFPAPEN